jgi:iron complex transport system ATP-binding protein
MSLVAHDLSVAFGKRIAVDGLTFAAEQGRVLVLVGANASGKSTLLRSLAGLLPPTSRSITLDGEPLGSFSPARLAARIGWMTQRPSLVGRFTVRDVVSIGRFARPHDPEAIDAAIVQVGLEEHSDRPAEDLSVGQQQRVALARVLAQVPSDGVLLLDEPCAPLDPAQVEKIAKIIRSRAREGGTVIVAVHELRLARALGDDVLGLVEGRGVVSGEMGSSLDSKAIQDLYGVPSVEGPDGPLPALRVEEE